jgi:hypothetical protein
MTIRPLDFLDLPTITRYRNEVLTLDSARALTRGHPLGAMGLLAYINPARHLYAAISNGGSSALLGGVIHTRGETFAKLLYLAPSSNLRDAQLPALMRTTGFSVYAWQRLWDVSELEKTETGRSVGWRRVQSMDLPTVQSLHYQIVPPLLHPIEPAPNRLLGFIHKDVKCYASITAGMYGIVLTPLIHPEEHNVSEKISALIESLPDRRGRRVYLNVRSYQTWLEPVLADLGAKPSERQAVMVKHLAKLIKETANARVAPSNGTVQASRISRVDIDE